MTILEQKVKEYLTIMMGREPTTQEIQANLENPLIVSKIHNELNVSSSLLTINEGDDIQHCLDMMFDNGGGTVFLNPGTYTLTSDLLIPSGVTLNGASRDNVIIDCNTDYSVKIIGSNEYTTGTISINHGDTTVVGSGTVFTEQMIGQYILLDGSWYEILSVTDGTHLEIDTYVGSNLSGFGTVIATPNVNGQIQNMTIINSNIDGLNITYTMETIVYNLYIYDCVNGMKIEYSVFPQLYLSSNYNEVNLIMNYVEGFSIDFSEFNYSTVGNGITITNSKNATILNSSITDNTNNGISMTDCSKIAILSFDISGNESNGVEFISNCNDNQFTDGTFEGNGLNGLKLTATSDRNIFSQITTKDNGAYGINISNANCNDNILIGFIANNNTSGSISDSGTGTLKNLAVNILP